MCFFLNAFAECTCLMHMHLVLAFVNCGCGCDLYIRFSFLLAASVLVFIIRLQLWRVFVGMFFGLVARFSGLLLRWFVMCYVFLVSSVLARVWLCYIVLRRVTSGWYRQIRFHFLAVCSAQSLGSEVN